MFTDTTNRTNNYLYHLFFLFILFCFVLFKWSHLALPYCWDEEAFYSPALRHMYDRAVSLSPQAIPVDYSRGHPLLFHFLGVCWMNIFGPSLVSTHIFALSISVILLTSIYLFCTKIFSEKIALTAVLIILVQPMFLAQSGLILPEILLSLFMITALFSYINGYRILYWIAAACAIMTKETTIILFCSIPLYKIVLAVLDKEKNYAPLIKELLFIISPLFVWLLFLVWQKILLGWFFFPDHTGYIDFTPDVMWEKFSKIFLIIFIWSGRNVMSFICLILLTVFLKRKDTIAFPKSKPYFLLFCIFIFAFILISSVNFFTNRYIISLLFLFSIMTAYTIQTVLTNKIIAWIAVSVILISGLYNSVTIRTDCDHNLGYVDAAIAKMHAREQRIP